MFNKAWHWYKTRDLFLKLLLPIVIILIICMPIAAQFALSTQNFAQTPNYQLYYHPTKYTFLHKVGVFSLAQTLDKTTDSQLAKARSLGISFTTHTYIIPGTPLYILFEKYHMHYLDVSPLLYLESVCGTQAVANSTCHLGSAQEKLFLSEISKHLQDTKNDPLIVGYYTLDTYIGNVQNSLTDSHLLIQKANQFSSVKRGTICGFYAPLDNVNENASRSYFDQAVANYAPLACDSVAIFSYAVSGNAVDSSSIDWSMTNLLPYVFAKLQSNGWDQSKNNIIGVSQTYVNTQKDQSQEAWTAPTAEAIALQMESYCKNGAVNILTYAWGSDMSSGVDDLQNTSSFQNGFINGVAACSKIWQIGK